LQPDVARIRAAYLEQQALLLAPLRRSGASSRGVGPVLRQLSRLADDTVTALWRKAGLDSEGSLVAVGGWGRAELFPHSDIDILVLLPDGAAIAQDAALQAKVEVFIGSCWDCGLDIGSSVRTVQECLEQSRQDITVQTSLLEARRVAGNAALFARFRTQHQADLDPRAFFVAKTLEMQQRHNRTENTPYALEPNCKESPGGLRDLQVILWVAKAARLGAGWQELGRNGLATAFEVRQLKNNEALLRLLRLRLHLAAGRREDRLVFDLQTPLAAAFGYDTQIKDGYKVARRASELLMRRYYWAAKAVSQLSQILLLNIEEKLDPSTHAMRPINERFGEKANMIEVLEDDLYQRQPQAILETFLLYQTTVGLKGLSARTLRALYNARRLMDARFRRDPANRVTFARIMQQPEGITHALRLMNQTSVLGRYLWAFRRIVGQMQHDLFHVYTVDQHILMVVRNMRRFFIVEHAHEYPFCSQLAAGWDKPWILYVAALFHDIAKGRGGDHSALGVLEARRFCRQHGLHLGAAGAEDAALIEYLVAEHLSMSRVAQKEDLSDPEVITAFARRVGSERRLTALYLLTVADIRGTSPKVWNAWKGKLLEDLYRLTLRVLGGGAPDPYAEVEARKREALVLLALRAEPFEGHKALWETLDVGYFMRHDANDIAWHTRHLSRHLMRLRDSGKAPDAPRQALVRARSSPLGEGLQVLVYTADQPDLFARICGYFDRAGFNILDARVHTARNGFALDTFQVVAPQLDVQQRELVALVESGLKAALDLRAALPTQGSGRVRISRRVRSFPITPRVELHPDERAQRWLLNISASDRSGLLYSVAKVLARHHINVQMAKISTLGERVEDTFLIDGEALQHNREQLDIETELLQALTG
jgi:[protein-PII] uridylyltransferase